MTFEEMNELRKKFAICLVIGGGCILVAVVCLLFGLMFLFPLFIVGFVIVTVGLFLYGRQYGEAYKQIVIKTALQEVFQLDVYQPNQGFDYDFVKSCQLIPMGDRYHSDDYVEASYHGVRFMRADVHTEDETTDSDGKTTTTTLFNGTWTIFDLPKDVNTYIIVQEKRFLGNWKPGGLFSKWKVHRVQVEDVAFNQQFVIYAQDEHDAFYMLSPKFMEQIKALSDRLDGRFILGVTNHQLHVILDTGFNSLEAGFFKEITSEQINEVKESLQYIVDIIETFGLEHA